MRKSIMSPSKYVQGYEEIQRLGNHVEGLANKFIILATANGMRRSKDDIIKSFEGKDINLVFEVFNGECSKVEVNRLIDIVNRENCGAIIGVGGGKLLDTAKAVAYYEKMPVVIVPTIASTDAPCSALSVLYTEEGVFDEYLVLPQNPNLVLMDTKVVANAPARLLIAGMGDALATYFEARACKDSRAKNMAGDNSTKSAYALAKLCYDTLLEDGLKAKLAVENKVVTEAVENIIEANTYLSGIGFESGGLAAAHAIHNGFTVLEDCHHLYHGEKVAFGTIVQLVMENAPLEEIAQVIYFCNEVGLPVTLEKMGIKEINKEDIMSVAKASCNEGETIYNMPFEITPELVYASILTADKLGKEI